MTQHNTEIPQGYKQTKVGIIPEDWEVKRISEVGTVIGGGTPDTSIADFWNGSINWFTPTEIKEKYATESSRKITELGLKNSSAKLLPIGTILLTTRATIGEASISTSLSTTNQGFQSIVVNSKVCTLFLYDLIKIFKNELYRRANGSTFLEISGKELEKIPIPVPPLPEQEKIADCLTTWDEAITQTKKLIAAKKKAKKGLMQQLLTGKKRLAGFTDEWKEVRLGDVCSYKNGQSLESKIISGGMYNLITLNSINIDGEIKQKHHKVNYNDNSLKKNDLVMILSDVAHGNFLGLSVIIPDNNFVLNQRVGRLRIKAKGYINSYFLQIMINQNQSYFKRMGQGSSQKNLSKGDILKFKFEIPPIQEQTAIADILESADKEIRLLEQKLQALERQKKGLMQVLLTGKKRLV